MEKKYISQRKRPSKKDRARILLNTLLKWEREGLPLQEGVSKLTKNQYNFLNSFDIIDDDDFFKAEHRAVKDKLATFSPPIDIAYSKKYPSTKQGLYNSLNDLVKNIGGVVKEREKENYRDIDFELDQTVYKILLSATRNKEKKNNE